jgi:hypothetical protein
MKCPPPAESGLLRAAKRAGAPCGPRLFGPPTHARARNARALRVRLCGGFDLRSDRFGGRVTGLQDLGDRGASPRHLGGGLGRGLIIELHPELLEFLHQLCELWIVLHGSLPAEDFPKAICVWNHASV